MIEFQNTENGFLKLAFLSEWSGCQTACTFYFRLVIDDSLCILFDSLNSTYRTEFGIISRSLVSLFAPLDCLLFFIRQLRIIHRSPVSIYKWTVGLVISHYFEYAQLKARFLKVMCSCNNSRSCSACEHFIEKRYTAVIVVVI